MCFLIDYNPTRLPGTLHEDLRTSVIISRCILRRMGNASDRVVEKIKTHILHSVTFFLFENRAVCEIMWTNMVQPDWPQTTIWQHAHCMLHT